MSKKDDSKITSQEISGRLNKILEKRKAAENKIKRIDSDLDSLREAFRDVDSDIEELLKDVVACV